MSASTRMSPRLILMIAVNLSGFAAAIMSSGINVALPRISDDFNMDAVALSWVVTVFLLTNTVVVLPLGRIADIYGRKKIFIAGTITYIFMSILCALAWSSSSFIPLRAVQGIGSATLLGTGMALLTSAFPLSERGKVLGTNIATVYAGLTLGPLLGGLLTQTLGWRSIFYFSAGLSLISLTLILWKVKDEWIEAHGEGIDYIGAVIYMAAIVAIIYGFSNLPQTDGIIITICGIIAMAVFILWERRQREPLLNLNLFKSLSFSFSNLAALFTYIATFGLGVLLSLYLQYIKGLSPGLAGLILITQPGIMAIIAPFSGTLSDRVEPRVVSSIGMAMLTAGITMFIFLDASTPIIYLIGAMAIMGGGFGLFTSPNTNAIMSSVNKKFYGVATGVLATVRTMGQTLSLAIATILFAVFIGRARIEPANYPMLLKSIHIAMIIFAVLCFTGIFASLARGNLRQGQNGANSQ